jgi:hypothetical protein
LMTVRGPRVSIVSIESRFKVWFRAGMVSSSASLVGEVNERFALRFHDQTMAPFPTRCRLNPQTELGNWFRAPFDISNHLRRRRFRDFGSGEAIGR